MRSPRSPRTNAYVCTLAPLFALQSLYPVFIGCTRCRYVVFPPSASVHLFILRKSTIDSRETTPGTWKIRGPMPTSPWVGTLADGLAAIWGFFDCSGNTWRLNQSRLLQRLNDWLEALVQRARTCRSSVAPELQVRRRSPNPNPNPNPNPKCASFLLSRLYNILKLDVVFHRSITYYLLTYTSPHARVVMFTDLRSSFFALAVV